MRNSLEVRDSPSQKYLNDVLDVWDALPASNSSLSFVLLKRRLNQKIPGITEEEINHLLLEMKQDKLVHVEIFAETMFVRRRASQEDLDLFVFGWTFPDWTLPRQEKAIPTCPLAQNERTST